MKFIRIEDTFINPDSIAWFAPETVAEGSGGWLRIVGLRIEFVGGNSVMISGIEAWHAFSGWAQQGGNATHRILVGAGPGGAGLGLGKHVDGETGVAPGPRPT